MASLHLACSAVLRPGRLAIAASRQLRHLQAAAGGRVPAPQATAASAARQSGAPAARQAAHQHRLAEIAEEVCWSLQEYSNTYWARRTGFPEQLDASAVTILLQAGMSSTGVKRLLQERPGLLAVDTQQLAAYAAAVHDLMQGITKKRVSLANKLGSAAASAALAQIPPASFSASCELAAELAAAALADAAASRAATLSSVLTLCSERSLSSLLSGGRNAAELRAVFTALQQHLGWSAQQAGAALLGLGLQAGPDGKQRVSCEGAPRLQLHQTSVQHMKQIAGVLRQYGLQGDELASATFAAPDDWAAIAPAEAEAALAVFGRCLGQFGLPPRLPAMLWLAARATATDPPFIGTWVWLAHAGAPAEHLESLATALLSPNAKPACFASSMQLLCELLDSWPAAAEAAAADPSLLALTACWLPQADLGPSPLVPDFRGLGKQLRASGTRQERLLRLAKCVVTATANRSRLSPTQALGSLQLLTTLLGSSEAAVEAVEGDSRLLHLHYEGRHMQTVFERLSTAGLTNKQLLCLASICNRHYYFVDRLIWMAEELYAGDWHAGMLEFLRGWRVYVYRLCTLRSVLDQLSEAGLQAVNDTGRQHVLQRIKRYENKIELEVRLPAGSPAEQRPAAALAALEQGGFRVKSSDTLQLIERLSAVIEEGFKVKLGSSDLEISSLDGHTALYPTASTA